MFCVAFSCVVFLIPFATRVGFGLVISVHPVFCEFTGQSTSSQLIEQAMLLHRVRGNRAFSRNKVARLRVNKEIFT